MPRPPLDPSRRFLWILVGLAGTLALALLLTFHPALRAVALDPWTDRLHAARRALRLASQRGQWAIVIAFLFTPVAAWTLAVAARWFPGRRPTPYDLLGREAQHGSSVEALADLLQEATRSPLKRARVASRLQDLAARGHAVQHRVPIDESRRQLASEHGGLDSSARALLFTTSTAASKLSGTQFRMEVERVLAIIERLYQEV
jgi:hypothetical protein